MSNKLLMNSVQTLRKRKSTYTESLHYKIPLSSCIDLHSMKDFLIYSGANTGSRFTTDEIQSILHIQKKLKSIYDQLKKDLDDDTFYMFYCEYRNVMELEASPLIEKFRQRQTFQTFKCHDNSLIKRYSFFIEPLLDLFEKTNHKRTIFAFSSYLADLIFIKNTLSDKVQSCLFMTKKASRNFHYPNDTRQDYQNSFYHFLIHLDEFKNWEKK